MVTPIVSDWLKMAIRPLSSGSGYCRVNGDRMLSTVYNLYVIVQQSIKSSMRRDYLLLEDLLNRNCLFCGGSRTGSTFLPPDRFVPDGQPIQLVVCVDCGTFESVLDVENVKIEGPDANYLPHQTPGGLRGWLATRSQLRKVSIIKPWVGGGKLVDIGCGSGGFMNAWRSVCPGERVVGIESSPRAVEAARVRGLEVIETSIEVPLPEEIADGRLYTMWHVLEHLEDPVSTLTHIREIMAPEGKIVVVVPNAAATERTLFGAHTVAWDPPRHRWHFTPEGLTGLMNMTGLRVVERFNMATDDLYDAVASLQWVLYPRVWMNPGSLKGRLATGLAVAGGTPTGLLLAALSPWRHRASLGMVLARVI